MGSLPKEPGDNSPWWEEEGYKGLLIEYEALKNASSRIALSYDFPPLAQEWLREPPCEPSYSDYGLSERVLDAYIGAPSTRGGRWAEALASVRRQQVRTGIQEHRGCERASTHRQGHTGRGGRYRVTRSSDPGI